MNTNTLAINGGTPTISFAGPHYIWPRITPDTTTAVMRQLETGEISIYDRSGIFEKFENAFVDYHGGGFHALVQNSGTSAIWSMFVGADLLPGDEVIVPSYSFYASYSPLMWTGATPVFADCGVDGNILPESILALITPRTRAVLVTHMWGHPCNMPWIVDICREHHLLLFEDCSHAHGAQINGQKVGTFGDAAAWSLQGQKIITGGEGGIMLTRNEEIYIRATLLGQYNKRAKQATPKDHPLYKYALTGMGLKLRAHPFAIAMAMEQLGHLDQWLLTKAVHAAFLDAAIKPYPFITTPPRAGKPAWYSFVFQYDEQIAGVSIDIFEAALRAEGLVEIDRPGSTCPNHNLPLFTQPDKVLRHLYSVRERRTPISRPGSERFFHQAMKLPVWAFEDEFHTVLAYVRGLRKVCDTVYNRPHEFRKR